MNEKANPKETKQNLQKKKKGNSLRAPKSVVLVGKLIWQPRRRGRGNKRKAKGLREAKGCVDSKFFYSNEEKRRRRRKRRHR